MSRLRRWIPIIGSLSPSFCAARTASGRRPYCTGRTDNDSHRIYTTKIDSLGNSLDSVLLRTELLNQLHLHPRDLRFSTPTALCVRDPGFILRLCHIKAFICSNYLLLLESNSPAVQEFIPVLKDKVKNNSDKSLPFEFITLEILLSDMVTRLEASFQQQEVEVKTLVADLLDTKLSSIDRSLLFVLLQCSKSLTSFISTVDDLEATLEEILDNEDDMAAMYLTYYDATGLDKSEEDTEELMYLLETYLMQVEDILSRARQLKEVIEQSESAISINLDNQRNIMLRLGLQLEMGMFSATVCGLIGMAFGMNLDSSLEENPYAFWIMTGIMFMSCGLLWRRLLGFFKKPPR